MRILFMGAPIAQHSQADLTWRQKFAAMGHNTGNLLIGQSLREELRFDEHDFGRRIPAAVANDRFDIIVIAAANFIFRNFDLGSMADYIESTNLPCVMVGLGAQAPSGGDRLTDIPAGTLRLLRVVSERSKVIGVRGYYTAEVVSELGIKNVRAVGCPSLYRTLKRSLKIKPIDLSRPLKVSLNGSRNVFEHSSSPVAAKRAEGDLLRLFLDEEFSYVLQNEEPELDIVCLEQIIDYKETINRIIETLGLNTTVDRFVEVFRLRGNAFFALDDWDKYIIKYDYSIGTRFHGNIIALTNGVPATIITHDSRTTEMAELMSIPFVPVEKLGKLDWRRVASVSNYSLFEQKYEILYDRFAEFLTDNGLEHKLNEAARPRQVDDQIPLGIPAVVMDLAGPNGVAVTADPGVLPRPPEYIYTADGNCPVCEKDVQFVSKFNWYRDHLFCSNCGSIPRDRALALTLTRYFPKWRTLAIHELSPEARGLSVKLKADCSFYSSSRLFTQERLQASTAGLHVGKFERQIFAENSFDIVVTQDVMQYVNEPKAVFADLSRAIKAGGAYLFTVPTYKKKVSSERRALYRPDGAVRHLAEPEYNGDPKAVERSLVTFHYGYDLAENIRSWSGMDVEVIRFHDHYHGIIGEFTELYVAYKR